MEECKWVAGLFDRSVSQPVIEAEVRSFRGAKPLTGEAEHYRLYPLIPFDPRQAFETHYVEIDPQTVFQGEPHAGNVYEYVFVVKGALQIYVEGGIFGVKANEFLHFQANRSHEYQCIGKNGAAAIMQISYLS